MDKSNLALRRFRDYFAGMNSSFTSVRNVGLIWAAQVCTANYYWRFRALEFTAGPTDVCALGIFIWVTAKWRRVLTALRHLS